MSIARGTPTLKRSIKNLHDLETDALWNKLLRHQIAFYSVQDLALFHNLEAWHQSGRVLEIGCGTGEFLKTLCERYPDKKYIAIDHSYEALQQARKRLKPHSVRIFQDDIYNFDLGLEKVDFIILRFVTQELPDINLLMTKLRKLLKPGGTILFVEANDEMASMTPRTPEFERLFKYIMRAKKSRYDHGSALRNASEHFGYRRILDRDVPVTAVHVAEKRRFRQLVLNMSEVVNRESQGKVDQVKVYRQLKSWLQDPHSYAQFGLNYLVLQKVDAAKEYAQLCHVKEKAKIFRQLGKKRLVKLLTFQMEYLIHEQRNLSAAFCLLDFAHHLGLTTRVQRQLQESSWIALRGFAAVPTFRQSKAEILRLQCRELYQICRENGWRLS